MGSVTATTDTGFLRSFQYTRLAIRVKRSNLRDCGAVGFSLSRPTEALGSLVSGRHVGTFGTMGTLVSTGINHQLVAANTC